MRQALVHQEGKKPVRINTGQRTRRRFLGFPQARCRSSRPGQKTFQSRSWTADGNFRWTSVGCHSIRCTQG